MLRPLALGLAGTAMLFALGCGDASTSDELSAERTQASSASAVFGGKGVFVVSPAASFSGGVGQVVHDAGFTWVALQIADGSTVLDEASYASWIAEWRKHVAYVGAWGVNRLEPQAEAALVAGLVKEYGFDFYIANAEQEYKYSQGNDYCGPCFERSAAFVAAFRSIAPDLPAAVSSFGRVDLADIDWRVWSNAGFHFLPQTYWNESEIYQPSASVSAALEWIRPGGDGKPFWTADQVHPTFGLWGGGQKGYVSAQSYLDDFAAAEAHDGVKGFSVYRGDMCPSSEWPVLAGSGAAPPSSGSSTSGGGCMNACGAGAKECVDGDRYIECGDFDADGCTEWSAPYSCGTSWPGTTCSSGYCVGSSGTGSSGTGGGDGCTDVCPSGGKQCVDGDLYQDCGNFDADTCTEWSPNYSCSVSWPGTHCNNGWCVY